jgi:predicted peroxiredoxin
MALKMASLMSTDRDVLVYVDLKGVETVVKDAPDLTFPSFESSRAQIAGLLAKGVPIHVCPGCLKALGHKPEELMPGLRVADKEAFFNFTKGRILTLDY